MQRVMTLGDWEVCPTPGCFDFSHFTVWRLYEGNPQDSRFKGYVVLSVTMPNFGMRFFETTEELAHYVGAASKDELQGTMTAAVHWSAEDATRQPLQLVPQRAKRRARPKPRPLSLP